MNPRGGQKPQKPVDNELAREVAREVVPWTLFLLKKTVTENSLSNHTSLEKGKGKGKGRFCCCHLICVNGEQG